ncbi:MAG: hypothetical protein ACM3L9_01280 [Deltaproteobacteria bacterium]
MLPALNHTVSVRRRFSGSAGAFRAVLALSAILALIAGILAGAVLASPEKADPALDTLLRFMALIKAAIATGAAALAAWRFGFPIPPKLATGYIAAVVLMALSPGLIWFQSGLVLASAFFHSGLLLGFALAAGDGLAKQRK